MAWMSVLGPCYACGRIFAFSAERVPALVIAGEREPICGDCIGHANRLRAANGLPALEILPGAYEPDEVP